MSGAERWEGVGKKQAKRSAESAEWEVAERERSGERAELAAHGRSNLLSTVQFATIISLVH